MAASGTISPVFPLLVSNRFSRVTLLLVGKGWLNFVRLGTRGRIHDRPLCSGHDIPDHFPVDISQAIVSAGMAVGQVLMIQAH